ncbi:COG4315 family predicted lipoprotein [Cognatilysobacter tabacisoli]|uniref:COG4315 family predicted lipoprotein n=1 Tax=Cognatilysobacter tabacisoli TaxID=2315424 RepID=UPI000E6AF507|nr:hypothetical protein [Lysobacter tabacisoli]
MRTKLKRRASTALLALSLGMAGVCAHAGGPPVNRAPGFLADTAGRALYTYDKDTAGTSNCYAQCAVLWPPLLAGDADAPTGDFTLVVRKDGRRQWAFKGMPLYYWVSDRPSAAPTGEAVAGWHLVR